MTPLSRWKLKENEEVKIKKLLVDQLTVIGKSEEMREFMNVILTETELLMIAKRLIVLLLIDQGQTDMEIGKLLHMTRATVNKYRLAYKYEKSEKGHVEKIVVDLKNNEEVKKLLERLKEYLITAPFGKIPKKSLI